MGRQSVAQERICDVVRRLMERGGWVLALFRETGSIVLAPGVGLAGVLADGGGWDAKFLAGCLNVPSDPGYGERLAVPIREAALPCVNGTLLCIGLCHGPIMRHRTMDFQS